MWKYVVCMVLLMGMVGEVQAQVQSIPIVCSPAELQSNILRQKFKEESIAYGVTNSEKLMELWLSKENDTWTITVRMKNGKLCLVAAGSGWRNAPEMLKGTKS
jgi:hypothetical protein